MKQLLIMRHAKSDWHDSQLSDHERPLNGRGLTDAPHMGQWLQQNGITPDLIVSSTANRAQTTAKLLIEAAGFNSPLITHNSFYLAPPSAYIHYLQQLENQFQRVMVVGHNPGLEELVTVLTGEHIYFTTANIADVSLQIEQWNQLQVEKGVALGQLRHIWRPREI